MDKTRALNMVVTGGAGFVASHLIKKLLAEYKKASIVSLDNYFSGQKENHVDDQRVTYLAGDTRDLAAVWGKVGKGSPDVLFHLGEYARIAQSFDDIDEVWEFNVRGTKEVVKFCHAHQSTLVPVQNLAMMVSTNISRPTRGPKLKTSSTSKITTIGSGWTTRLPISLMSMDQVISKRDLMPRSSASLKRSANKGSR
jgi:nucleoside-diphosphate-sugar epimerase